MVESIGEYIVVLRYHSSYPLYQVFRKPVKETATSDSMCAICLEAFEKGDRVALSRNKSCSHIFHVDCITQWLMKHNDCPCCRLAMFESADTKEERDVRLGQGLELFDELQQGESALASNVVVSIFESVDNVGETEQG